MLGYLGEGVAPVSVELRNTIKAPNSYQITRKAERYLLNEHTKSINNTIELCSLQLDKCIEQSSGILENVSLRECQAFISRVREARHNGILNVRKLRFPGCGTEQVNSQTAVVAMMADAYINITVAVQTPLYLVFPIHSHASLLKQQQQNYTTDHSFPHTTSLHWQSFASENTYLLFWGKYFD